MNSVLNRKDRTRFVLHTFSLFNKENQKKHLELLLFPSRDININPIFLQNIIRLIRIPGVEQRGLNSIHQRNIFPFMLQTFIRSSVSQVFRVINTRNLKVLTTIWSNLHINQQE